MKQIKTAAVNKNQNNNNNNNKKELQQSIDKVTILLVNNGALLDPLLFKIA